MQCGSLAVKACILTASLRHLHYAARRYGTEQLIGELLRTRAAGAAADHDHVFVTTKACRPSYAARHIA